jgi:hypothetical protein
VGRGAIMTMSGPAALAVLAGPWVVWGLALLLAGWLASRVGWMVRPIGGPARAPAGENGAVARGTAAIPAPRAPMIEAEPRPAAARRPTPAQAPTPAAPVRPAPSRESLATLEARISEAERRGDEQALGRLHLEVALREREAGAPDRAAEALRRAIRIAARERQNDVHAAARLELGDLAEQMGDLTTACEHWQLARDLFHGLGRRGEVEAADKRMRTRGCPTDWVLNDF